jgi:hypothetical protein
MDIPDSQYPAWTTIDIKAFQIIEKNCPKLRCNVKNHPVTLPILICCQYIDFPNAKKIFHLV